MRNRKGNPKRSINDKTPVTTNCTLPYKRMCALTKIGEWNIMLHTAYKGNIPYLIDKIKGELNART